MVTWDKMDKHQTYCQMVGCISYGSAVQIPFIKSIIEFVDLILSVLGFNSNLSFSKDWSLGFNLVDWAWDNCTSIKVQSVNQSLKGQTLLKR